MPFLTGCLVIQRFRPPIRPRHPGNLRSKLFPWYSVFGPPFCIPCPPELQRRGMNSALCIHQTPVIPLRSANHEKKMSLLLRHSNFSDPMFLTFLSSVTFGFGTELFTQISPCPALSLFVPFVENLFVLPKHSLSIRVGSRPFAVDFFSSPYATPAPLGPVWFGSWDVGINHSRVAGDPHGRPVNAPKCGYLRLPARKNDSDP
jgi:hypothetical protein